MEALKDNNMSRIKHYPKGENPYKILGHERIPYLPTEGEEVVVSAVVKEKEKYVYLLLNDSEKVHPSTQETNKDEVQYSFNIGPFNKGDEVNYRFISGEHSSSLFSFIAGNWMDVTFDGLNLKGNNIYIAANEIAEDLCVRFNNGNIMLSAVSDNGDKITQLRDCVFESGTNKIRINNNPLSLDVIDVENVSILKLKLKVFITDKLEKIKLVFNTESKGIFGLGEKFNGANQVEMQPKNVVFEKFTQQGEISYFPVPFLYSTANFGVFADTNSYIDYHLSQDEICMSIEMLDDIYIIPGSIKRAILEYTKLTGDCTLPPKWAFGTWISANRWNCQKHIDEQVEYIKNCNYPTNVLVVEAWSDEATFYVFNESVYKPKKGFLSAEDITYGEDGLWPNPQKMIDELHDMGIKVILWQAPMIKLLEKGRQNEQQDIDRKEVVESDLVIKNNDGSPYTIPEGYWFGGSYVPDFSNPETCKWVADKRKHLMDMGIDGFKTDGGEFIYYDYLKAFNDREGRGIRNDYSYQYEKAYTEMLNEDGVLFSRAGYKGAQQFPVHWAGDQQSLFSEFRDVIKAGLSLGLSGVPFWGFDIGGFANKLPTKELYLRWTSMAVFAPIFQWHSEPTFGQFADVIKGDGGINDRSPWNMADYHSDKELLDLGCYFANMRMNFLPYIYQAAEDCAENSKPMFQHLYYDNQDDENTINIEDEFMLGNLLIAPIVHEGETKRKIYLPKGQWENIFTGSNFDGKISIYEECGIDEISVFIKTGSGIMLNLNDNFELGASVGNSVDEFINPCIYISGDTGEYEYIGAGIDCSISWTNGNIELVNNTDNNIYVLSANVIKNMSKIGNTKFNSNIIGVYQTKEG